VGVDNNLKQLKSSLSDLRELFERSITVREIAEPLASFDFSCSIDEVNKFMVKQDYDVIGIRKDGIIDGYVKKSDLLGGKFDIINFQEEEKFPQSKSLIDVFKAFQSLERIFVLVFGQVGGIVTRGDLQKSAIRMWLFGIISLIEMQLLRIIREQYPDDGWKSLLIGKRLTDAENILNLRREKNVAIDLADCLQICDKSTIVLKTEEVLRKLCVDKKSCKRFFKDLETLRNNLAHAQDIITGNWPGIIDLAKNAEDFLKKCEDF
jgi:hypothetical protein